jgi:hypothetical protein
VRPKNLVTSAQRLYIARETTVNVVINTMISAVFMKMAFGGRASINLWGPHGLVLDFVPQTFMISAMSILVPTLIARRRMRCGVMEPLRLLTLPPALQPLWRRSLLLAGTLTGVAGGIGTGLLTALSADPLTFWDVFPLKLGYGALIAAIATPIGLVMALSEDREEAPTK